MEPPAGFRLVENRPGVALYRKDYQNGSPDYVQVVDLSVGASVDLLYGKPQGNDGKKSQGIFDGANPAFGYRTIHGYWQAYAQTQLEAFCVTNGQFFFMPENPAPLALPLKVDGNVVAEGFGYPQYPEKQLMLALWPDRADILPLTHENLYGTTAPDAIGDEALEELLGRLEHASASIGMASRDLSVTLTVEASCSADATRIGVWMVRAAVAASGLDALSNVRAEVEFVED